MSRCSLVYVASGDYGYSKSYYVFLPPPTLLRSSDEKLHDDNQYVDKDERNCVRGRRHMCDEVSFGE